MSIIGLTRKHIVFAPLSYLRLSIKGKDRLRIAKGVYLTSNPKVIRQIVPLSIKGQIGSLHYDDLFKSKTIIYFEESVSSLIPPIEYLNRKINAAQDFLTYSWLIEDNNINIDTFYLLVERKSDQYDVHSNFTGTFFYRSNSKSLPVTLTNKTAKLVAGYMAHNESHIERNFGGKKTTNFTRDISRLNVVLFHIINSRRQSDAAMKITSYCSAMESLVSTNQSELTHQVSERMAFLLSSEPSSRLELYRKVKRAYTLRSKYIHGSTFRENENDSLLECCEFCDSALRSSIEKLYDNEILLKAINGTNAELDEFMRNLIFGIIKV